MTKLTYRQTITPFLLALVDLLITKQSMDYEKALLDALLTSLAQVERLRKNPDFADINKLWEDEDLWMLCLKHKPSDLAIAGVHMNSFILTPTIHDQM